MNWSSLGLCSAAYCDICLSICPSMITCLEHIFTPFNPIWLIITQRVSLVKSMQWPWTKFVGLSIRSLQNYMKNLCPIIYFLPLAKSGSYLMHRVPLVSGWAVTLNEVYRSRLYQTTLKSFNAYILYSRLIWLIKGMQWPWISFEVKSEGHCRSCRV